MSVIGMIIGRFHQFPDFNEFSNQCDNEVRFIKIIWLDKCNELNTDIINSYDVKGNLDDYHLGELINYSKLFGVKKIKKQKQNISLVYLLLKYYYLKMKRLIDGSIVINNKVRCYEEMRYLLKQFSLVNGVLVGEGREEKEGQNKYCI